MSPLLDSAILKSCDGQLSPVYAYDKLGGSTLQYNS